MSKVFLYVVERDHTIEYLKAVLAEDLEAALLVIGAALTEDERGALREDVLKVHIRPF